MFRVSHRGDRIGDAETIEGAREIIRGQSPGRYDVDEIRTERFPSGRTSRAWGEWSVTRTGELRRTRGRGQSDRHRQHGTNHQVLPAVPKTHRPPEGENPSVGLALGAGQIVRDAGACPQHPVEMSGMPG